MAYTTKDEFSSGDITTLTGTNQKVSVHDGSNVAITSTVVGADTGLDTNVVASALPSGAATSANQSTIISNLQTLNSLIPSTYDYASLSYTGNNLTSVVFKSGGAGGTTVSTITLTYTGSLLTSFSKS